MEKRACAVEGCPRPSRRQNDLCKSHNEYLRRTGARPTRPLRAYRLAPELRFAEKYRVDESGCWIWQAKLNASGYGSFGIAEDDTVLAHRFAYELHIGPIPEGLQLDHLCRVRACCNPDHLEPVTSRENTIRGHVARGVSRQVA